MPRDVVLRVLMQLPGQLPENLGLDALAQVVRLVAGLTGCLLPPGRPRLPQLRQLPATHPVALRHQLADSTNAKNQEPPSTLGGVEPLWRCDFACPDWKLRLRSFERVLRRRTRTPLHDPPTESILWCVSVVEEV